MKHSSFKGVKNVSVSKIMEIKCEVKLMPHLINGMEINISTN